LSYSVAGVRDDLREEIRLDLFAKRISNKHVALELGVSEEHVSRILNGKSDTTPDNWDKIGSLVGKRLVWENLKDQ
jgi:plasmid maintenance system antidote protein VapI